MVISAHPDRAVSGGPDGWVVFCHVHYLQNKLCRQSEF